MKQQRRETRATRTKIAAGNGCVRKLFGNAIRVIPSKSKYFSIFLMCTPRTSNMAMTMCASGRGGTYRRFDCRIGLDTLVDRRDDKTTLRDRPESRLSVVVRSPDDSTSKLPRGFQYLGSPLRFGGWPLKIAAFRVTRLTGRLSRPILRRANSSYPIDFQTRRGKPRWSWTYRTRGENPRKYILVPVA